MDALHRTKPDAQGLNNILLQAGVEHFPTRASSRPRPWQTDTVQVTLKAMWAFRARAKLEAASYRRTGAFVHMFQAWKMITRFASMHRDFRRQGRISRKELWLTKLKEAEQAAAQGNSRTLFAVVRDLAPRRDPRPVQLRGSQGELLSPAKELQLLQDFCCDLFDFPATQNAPAPQPASITLDADEVLRSFFELEGPACESEAPCPGGLVALSGTPDSTILTHIANACFSTGRLPVEWVSAWLLWLAKPSKTTDRPGNLRPIALQDTGGKAVAKTLQMRMSEPVRAFLRPVPQFAFVKGRLLQGAILRAVRRCKCAQAAAARADPNIQDKWRGLSSYPCAGGVTLSLDLSQAFDRVNHERMHAAIAEAQLPEDLCQAVRCWNAQIRYELQVADLQASVRGGRGLRQGCVMSPTLWSALSGAFMRRLMEVTNWTWVQTLVHLFADDILEQWEISCLQDLEFLLRCIRATFLLLRYFGLKVNPTKSRIMLNLRGHQAKQWQRQWILRTPQGSFLRMTLDGQEERIPVVASVEYLGVVLSYRHAEAATARRRIDQAEKHRFRLQRVLNGKHALTLTRRLRIWHTCVSTSLYHGIACVGVTPVVFARIRRLVAKHIQLPAHVDRESTTDLFRRLQVMEPDLVMRRELDRLLHHVAHADEPMLPSHVYVPLILDLQESIMLAAAQFLHAPEHQEEAPIHAMPACQGGELGASVLGREVTRSATVLCPECHLAFGGMDALKRHCTQDHDFTICQFAGEIPRDVHGTGGLPTCAHCGHAFGNWSKLHRRIAEHNCKHWELLQGRLSAIEFRLLASPGQLPGLTPCLERPLRRKADWRSGISALSGTRLSLRLLLLAQAVPKLVAKLDEVLRQHLSHSGWFGLHVHKSYCRHLNNHCALCGQWIADARYFKHHTQNLHKTEWEKREDIEKECNLLAKHLSSPCQYCTREVARPGTHAAGCMVIWQAALLRRVWSLPLMGSYLLGSLVETGGGGAFSGATKAPYP